MPLSPETAMGNRHRVNVPMNAQAPIVPHPPHLNLGLWSARNKFEGLLVFHREG